jgi:hypothetical protein
MAAVFLFAGLVGWRVEAVGTDGNPHEPQGAATDAMCKTCHRETPSQLPENSTRTVLPKADDFILDPVAMCVSCHKDEEGEGTHPVGGSPDYSVPADLPLDKDGRVSCLTCHHVHGSIESDHQCASASALDRLFNRKHLRKSYLLRRDNPRGELCKACHQTTAQKKGKQP